MRFSVAVMRSLVILNAEGTSSSALGAAPPLMKRARALAHRRTRGMPWPWKPAMAYLFASPGTSPT